MLLRAGEGEKMLLIAAPGQGAQSPGFLRAWLEIPGAAERLGYWSELTGTDLIRMGTSAGADEINDTAITQPLLTAAALLVAEQLPRPHIAAGHSVGEMAAGAIAGVLSPQDAIRLTAVRGRAMAAAARAVPTGMTAVLGGDRQAVLAAIAEHGLSPANINAGDQIVAAGTVAQLAAFASSPPAGTKLRSLRVAGAFHTAHMTPAEAAFATAASDTKVSDPVITLLSNRDGAVVSSGLDWLERVTAQISAPVRWDQCTEAMAGLGVTVLIELPPAGILTGVAKRALRGVQVIPLKTPNQLDVVRQLMAEAVNEAKTC